MNKYQEELNNISYFVLDDRANGYDEPRTFGQFYGSSINVLQELVDKTIPREPLNIYYGLTEQEGTCPNCNKKIFEPLMELAYSKDDDLEYFTEVKLSNCNRCGQALKWK